VKYAIVQTCKYANIKYAKMKYEICKYKIYKYDTMKDDKTTRQQDEKYEKKQKQS
jgi:hypothetical protein